MYKKSGFTLIELLVVISIIGVLSLIGLVAYSSVLKNGRDAKRQTDLKVIQSALESYYNDQKYYPNAVNFGDSLTYGDRVYVNQLPDDPDATKHYIYTCPGNRCSKYCLYADGETNVTISAPGCTGHSIAVTSP